VVAKKCKGSVVKSAESMMQQFQSLCKESVELTWKLERFSREFELFFKEAVEVADSKKDLDEPAQLKEQLRINELKNSVDRLLRLKEVLEIVSAKKSSWWAGVKSGRYPAPVYTLGPKLPTWKLSSILQLVGGKAVCDEN